MNIKRLRLLTIILPVAFLIALEILSTFVFRPVLGNDSGLRLLIIFGVLSMAVVPFAVWVFRTIERQQRDLAESAELLESVRDYAIFMLDTEGHVVTWSPGAEHVKGFSEEEILGQHYSVFYPPEDIERGVPDDILRRAAKEGRVEVEGWRLRRDGSRFWANVVSTEVRDDGGKLLGFTHVTRDMTERRQADERIATLNDELEQRVTENSRLYEDARDARDRLQTWNQQLEVIVAERTRQIEVATREMTTRVLMAQEEERKHIARELHDETAQSLATILITLDLYESFLPEDNEPLRTGFDRIRDLACRTLDEIRALSHNLRPTILDDVGLVAALRWYADEHLRTFGVPVEVCMKVEDEPPLTPAQEIVIFRIAQEALNNSGKYAQAGKACISLSFDLQAATLVIEDDGKGFDPEKLTSPGKTGGFGFYGMRERAGLLDGRLTIDSAPGAGTRIRAVIPLPSEVEPGSVTSSDGSQERSETYNQRLEVGSLR